MTKEKMSKGPDVVHPEKPSAIGSRNSLNRDGRNEYQESAQLIDEEIDKVLNHLSSKLPPEVLNKLDFMGSVKDKLHNFYNQNLHNMQNRYLVTVEDEILKKTRDLVDREEFKQLNRYTPASISEIMEKIGGEDQFNTAALEKSMANVYKHLQGHLQRGVNAFEHNTNALLRQKNDVGAFVRKENAYAIVKCSFKNNKTKPQNVFDVKLAINILDSELISPIYHYQKPVQQLLKEILSDHIHRLIDQKIDVLNASRIDSQKDELRSDERLVEKLQALESYLSFNDEAGSDQDKIYDFVAKKLIDSLEGDNLEIPAEEFETQNIRDNVKRILDEENVRNRGFNRVVNALTSILDESKLGYQAIDNYKNARLCTIHEYAAKDRDELPDETFGLRLNYLDHEQLVELRKAYDLQFSELTSEIDKAMQVVDTLFEEHRRENRILSYKGLAKEILKKTTSSNGEKKWWAFWKGESTEETEEDVLWNELSFYSSKIEERDEITKVNQSQLLKQKIKLMNKRIYEIYEIHHPEERLILDERIAFLEDSFQKFSAQLNPHHIQQGLILEVNITSVKRKRTTLHAMSNVMNEFLFRVSRGFKDQVEIEPARIAAEDEFLETEKRFTSVLQNMDKTLEEVEA
jgi:hypothetical protein